ncbi:hypothetical protein EYF80_046651 [Liparis tanakae]|uniref:Uncharacterized protein n=1 Tax=Liparis tanakae TaxID=230148 RepID=A0A4Z2FPL2_9TELE|nr:hypothetical protein EYF80_046651 [Liparis tanakae]
MSLNRSCSSASNSFLLSGISSGWDQNDPIIPGVSITLMLSSTGLGSWAHTNLKTHQRRGGERRGGERRGEERRGGGEKCKNVLTTEIVPQQTSTSLSPPSLRLQLDEYRQVIGRPLWFSSDRQRFSRLVSAELGPHSEDATERGFLGSTTKALPGMTPSVSPCITAMKESVVGSGPIRMPGKSCSNR